MTGQTKMPNPFPVHSVGDNHWEVLIVPKNKWLSCLSEADARAIAAAPKLKYESINGVRDDPAFADELEKSAEVLAKYNIGFEARFLKLRADEIRKAATK